MPICQDSADENCIDRKLAVTYALLCHLARLYSEYCVRRGGRWVPAGAVAVQPLNFRLNKLLEGFSDSPLRRWLKAVGGVEVARILSSRGLSDVTAALKLLPEPVKVGEMEMLAISCDGVRRLACELVARLA